VHLASISEQELRDAIGTEHGMRRCRGLTSAIGGECRIRMQHSHQLVHVSGHAGMPEVPNSLLRFTTRRGDTRMRIAQAATRAREDLPRVRLALADASRDVVEVELEDLAQLALPSKRYAMENNRGRWTCPLSLLHKTND
jgi:hypothetical protein